MEREQLNYLLQQAPLDQLLDTCRQVESAASVNPIQKATPQTLLVPVKDPVSLGCFYSGEVLVTSSVIQVNGENGWAMVMDDNPSLANAVALLDGAFAAGICRQAIEELARLGMKRHTANNSRENSRVNTTRVEFDLL